MAFEWKAEGMKHEAIIDRLNAMSKNLQAEVKHDFL